MTGGRTTPRGTRPKSSQRHRLVPASRQALRAQFGSGLALSAGQRAFTCSCSGGPLWTDTLEQARRQHAEHAGTVRPPAVVADRAVEGDDGTVVVHIVHPAYAGAGRHDDQVTYGSCAAYDRAVAAGDHQRLRTLRHRSWLATQEKTNADR